VLVVVVIEETSAESPGVIDAPEALGERWAVLEGLELRLAVGVVVAHVRAGVRPGDAQEAIKLDDLVRGHGAAPVGVHRQLAGGHLVTGNGLFDQFLGQLG